MAVGGADETSRRVTVAEAVIDAGSIALGTYVGAALSVSSEVGMTVCGLLVALAAGKQNALNRLSPEL